MQNTIKKIVNLWIAFADSDHPAFQRLCDSFEREFWKSAYELNILNEGWGLKELSRNAEDDNDFITAIMQKADYVLACLTPNLNEEDLIAQLRRAHSLRKEIIIFYYGRICDKQGKPISQRFSADLFLILQGSKQVALWGSPTAELEAIFSNRNPSYTSPKDSMIFLSHNHKDIQLAKLIYDYLKDKEFNVFLSEETLPTLGSCDYMKEIDQALDNSKHMIIAGTSIENIMSGWVEAEWRLFINEKRSGRKTGNIITVIDNGLLPSALPMSLRYYEVINKETEGIDRLIKYVL